MVGGADDPLFLQVKEARASVLEPYAGPGQSAYSNHGQRVVMGQRLMLSASDIFLGWVESELGKHFFRQMHDMKLKPLVELFSPGVMIQYGEHCGWALADFSESYADQNERDYEALVKTVQQGRLEVYIER